MMYDIYLASPFFNTEQVEREEGIKAILKHMGFKVFSPKDNCFCPPNATKKQRQQVFIENVNAIKQSKAVFAITDNKDIGTIWEAGYAYASNVPIIYFAETLGDNPFNLMLAQSGIGVFTSREQLLKEFDIEMFNVAIGLGYKINDFEGVIE